MRKRNKLNSVKQLNKLILSLKKQMKSLRVLQKSQPRFQIFFQTFKMHRKKQVSLKRIKDVEELKTTTEELLSTNKSLVEEIKNQLGIAAGGSLSHTFNDRKEELEESTKR